MLYNIEKCHHVHIGANTEASKYEMASVDNRITIKRVESEKDLGVFNVDKLNFREHITKKKTLPIEACETFRNFTYIP